MDRHLLVAGMSGVLFDALVEEGGRSGCNLLVTIESGTDKSLAGDPGADSRHYTIWNRRSPLSARSVIIRATNAFESIDEIYIVYRPQENGRPFHELSTSDIESLVDSQLKGYLFLVREAIAQLQKQQDGALCFVYQKPGSVVADPLSAAMGEAFVSAVDAFFHYYQNEPYFMTGYRATTDEPAEFAHHALAVMQERPRRARGRWQQHGARRRLPFLR